MVLTHAEAQQRAATLRPQHGEIELILGLDDFESTATWTFSATPGSASFIDVKPAALLEATLNGAPLDVTSLADGRLPLHDLQADNTITVRATMAYSHDGEGLHRHIDPADGASYLYAMSFLDAAPRWFACFDQPDLKASLQLSVTTPDDSWIVRGNGPAEQLGPQRWHLRQDQPLASYFVTVVAGPYASVERIHDDIRLELLARASLSGDLERHADDLFATTALSFDAFHELFGIRYPYGDYVQAFVPDFNAGAMENPGCVTFREQLLFRGASSAEQLAGRANTVAHEMAHQWFGDLVTMAWWDDLWLNESFAEYLATRVIGEHTDHQVWTAFGARKAWGLEADQAPSTHPVAGNGAADTDAALANFDGISYAKGAALLSQLATRLGDDIFLAGLRDHISRHAGGNATAADLFASWTTAGAADLTPWIETWLLTSGVDVLRTRRDGDRLLLERSANPGGPPWRPHAVQVAAFDADGTELVRVPVEVERAAPGGAIAVDIDAELVGRTHAVLPDGGDQTWARLRWDEGWPLPRWGGIADSRTRVAVLGALRDGIRHADLSPSRALEIVLAALHDEDDVVLLGQLLTFAQALVGASSAAEFRADRQALLAENVAELLQTSPPDSDHRLLALRAVLATTSDIGLLQRGLAGESINGLPLDQEQRWLAVRRLQVLGESAEVIEDELAKDATTAGELAARTARAARRDTDAKAAAVQVLTDDRQASNAVLYAVAAGLFLPEHDELTADLVQPWLRGMVASAEFRGGWTLPRVIAGSVPWGQASPALVERLDHELAGELAEPVRRELRDARAQLERLVRLHALDRQTQNPQTQNPQTQNPQTQDPQAASTGHRRTSP